MMYIWEVILETEWKYVTKKGKKTTTHTDSDTDEHFTVAAPSGIMAIEKAKKVALDVKERGYVDDELSDGETVTASPIKILDVVGLSLKDTLDG